MATLAELRGRIRDFVDDKSFDSEIVSRINAAVTRIAGGMTLPGTLAVSPPLPELYTVGSVDTTLSTTYSTMPAGYQRDMVFCASASQSTQITIYKSFAKFVMAYPLLDETGSVDAVCVKGRTIYYQGIPASAETLTIHYYAFPTDMTSNAEEPEGIPAHLQEPLIVHRVCADIFALIESDDGGKKTQTAYHENLFLNALQDLSNFVGVDGDAQEIEDYSTYV